MDTSTAPHLLGGLDTTALAWTAGWSLLVSLQRIVQKRRSERLLTGEAKTPLSYVVLESLLGGVPFGMAAGLWLTEYQPAWATAGRLAGAAMLGSTVGPYLAGWALSIVPQAVAKLSEKYTGVRIVLKTEGDGVNGSPEDVRPDRKPGA